MSGNDRRAALLGCIEKIRKLIASFFCTLTQDEVHHACLRKQPYSTVQIQSIASGRQGLSDRHWPRRTDRICPAASLKWLGLSAASATRLSIWSRIWQSWRVSTRRLFALR